MATTFDQLSAEEQAKILAEARSRARIDHESELRAQRLAEMSLADYIEDLIAASARFFGYTIAIPAAVILDAKDFIMDTAEIVTVNVQKGWNEVMKGREAKRANKLERRAHRQGAGD